MDTAAGTADLEVLVTCGVCGRSIALQPSAVGPSLPDAESFLAQHRECLESPQPPRQAAGEGVGR